MSTVAEIEAAIEKLPEAELQELVSWIDDDRAMISSSEALFAAYDDEERSLEMT